MIKFYCKNCHSNWYSDINDKKPCQNCGAELEIIDNDIRCTEEQNLNSNETNHSKYEEIIVTWLRRFLIK